MPFNTKMDIVEHDKNDTISVEVPGVPAKDVKVEVQNGMLSISGERKEERRSVCLSSLFCVLRVHSCILPFLGDTILFHFFCAVQEETDKYKRIEHSFVAFQRSMRLPENANADGITALQTDGVLHVT